LAQIMCINWLKVCVRFCRSIWEFCVSHYNEILKNLSRFELGRKQRTAHCLKQLLGFHLSHVYMCMCVCVCVCVCVHMTPHISKSQTSALHKGRNEHAENNGTLISYLIKIGKMYDNIRTNCPL
jgi:hypothetical protein